MTTLGLLDSLSFLGMLLVGSMAPALLFASIGIAIYLLARRSGPATGALSALLNLVLLSVIPIMILVPMPKWWTVRWAPSHSISDQVESDAWSWAESSSGANGGRISAPRDLTQFAKENQTGSPSSEMFSFEGKQTAKQSHEVDFSWTAAWDQGLRVIGALLVAGWFLALARFTLGLRAVHRFRSQSQEISDPRTIELAQSIAEKVGFPTPVRLRQASGLVSAATVGWLHPVVLLPANWQQWTCEELRVVLAHEISHIARRDYLGWVLAQLCLSLHFYHPLAHWLTSRLRRDQELAADVLGSELCGGRENYLVTLSQLVLRQTSQAAPLLSRPVFSARGTFLWRMKMLHGKTVLPNARLKRFPVLLLGQVSLAMGLASTGVGISLGQAAAQEPRQAPKEVPPPGRETGLLKGRITADQSGKPVEGAMVRVLVSGDPTIKNYIELYSDKDGQYSCDIPVGNFSIFGVYSPAGYYIQDEKTYDFTTVAKKGTVVVRDFSLKTGKAWKVELADFTPIKERPAIFGAQINPQRTMGRAAEAIHTLGNHQGQGELVIPENGGHYEFTCYLRDRLNQFEISPIDLNIENGFDPTQVQGEPEVLAKDRSVRLKDRAGKVATVKGAQVVNRKGNAVLRFECKAIPKSAGFKAEGIVQDEGGKPVAGAKITASFGNDRGGSMSLFVANSGEDGKFTIPEIRLTSAHFTDSQRIRMVVVKSGFNGEDSKGIPLIEVQKNGVADFGIVSLKPGKTVRGKVVDQQGNPVQGAEVSCVELGFRYSHLTCRSDSKGQFVIPDLAHGKMKLWVNYGDRYGKEEFNFDENTKALTIPLRRNGNE